MENKNNFLKIIDFGNSSKDAIESMADGIEELIVKMVSEYIDMNKLEKSYGLDMLDAILGEIHKKSIGGEIIDRYAKTIENMGI